MVISDAVAIAECRQYDLDQITNALKQTLQGIGGWEPYIRKGERVLLKINLVMSKKADAHATSHPVFVQALAQLLEEYGAEVIIGDSPGGLFNAQVLRHVYRGTGIEKMAQDAGLQLNYNTETMEVENPDGKLMKHLTMTAMLKDVDHVISVCKLKTHGMMTYTGAVKNLFGTIPGTVKADYHVRMPNEDDFADAILDIGMAVRPVLSFMDAIVGMEGNGPTAGTPRPIGAILASANPHHLDMVAAGMIGLEASQVPTLRGAIARGFLDPARVWTVGENPERFRIADYKLPDHIHPDLLKQKLPAWMADIVSHMARAKVKFDGRKCIGCGICASNCPAEVIVMKDHSPAVDYKKCIRCFCCQELCPKEAVTVKESWIFKLINRL